MTRTIRLILIGIGVLAFGLLLGIAHSLASLGGIFYPALIPHFFIGLLLIEGMCVFYLWKSVFGGNDHLHFPQDASPEEQRVFTDELTARMRKNPLIVEAGIDPESPAFLEDGLALLSQKADEETKRASEKVFLATALAQNGKIDSLIVFVTLTRLVWRISKLYNQRPHPKEIVALYWAVVSSAFLALSFEELDISTEITVGFGEIFHAVAPAAMTSSVPFVGAAVQKFTSCSIDGAANAYLALRTGIITRNAYRYNVVEHKRPTRAAVYREAGGVLLGMASGLVEQVAKSIGGLMWEVTKKTPAKTANLIKNGATSVGDGLVYSAGKVAQSTSYLAKQTGSGVVKAGSGVIKVGTDVMKGAGAVVGGTAHTTATVVTQTAGGVAAMTQKGVGGVVHAVERGGEGVVSTAKNVGSLVSSSALSTAQVIGNISEKGVRTVSLGLTKTKEAVMHTTDSALHTADAALHMADKGLHKGKDLLQSGMDSTQKTVKSAVSATLHTAETATEFVGAGVQKTREAVHETASAVNKGAVKAREAVQETVSAVNSGAIKVGEAVNETASAVNKGAHLLKDGVVDVGKKTTGLVKRPFTKKTRA